MNSETFFREVYENKPGALERLNAYRGRLEKAFALVSDPHDWKAPIRAVVLVEDLDAAGLTVDDVTESVAFYTATDASVTVLVKPTGAVYVTALGYRAGPAGP